MNACRCTVEPHSATGDRRTPRGLLEAAVWYAVLAFSRRNTQSWRFEVEGNALLLFAVRTELWPDEGRSDRLTAPTAARAHGGAT